MKTFKFLLILILFCQCNKIVEVEKIVEIESTPKVINRDSLFVVKSFSEEALLKHIEEVNLEHPEIVFAQSVLESANYTSTLFVKHNNLFGMTIAKRRPTLNKSKHITYSSYSNWKHSVIDYAMFQSSYMRKLSTEQYYERLSKIYASDPEYVEKLKQIVMLKKGL